MICTLTMNPSVDRTATLAGELRRGGVNRLLEVDDCAGGKGVNVSRVCHDAGAPTLAVFPAPEADPFVAMCRAAGPEVRVVPTEDAVRVNLTVTEPDGTTTKLNAPGADPGTEALEQVAAVLAEAVGPGDWVVLSGSLPTGVEPDYYARLVRRLRSTGARIAVDTSDEPLRALAAVLPDAGPDLIKPNGEELGQLTGTDGAELERRAEAGDRAPVAAAARRLVDSGIGAVLVTLGGAGAVLATAEATWAATTPPVRVRSTVGAGDSSLAGYLLADAAGLPPADRLAWAVAHGSAAAALPGTGLPAGIDAPAAAASFTVTRLSADASTPGDGSAPPGS